MGGSVPLVEAEATSPMDEYTDYFNELHQSGIAIFLDKSIDIEEEKTINVELLKFLWFKKLNVEVV